MSLPGHSEVPSNHTNGDVEQRRFSARQLVTAGALGVVLGAAGVFVAKEDTSNSQPVAAPKQVTYNLPKPPSPPKVTARKETDGFDRIGLRFQALEDYVLDGSRGLEALEGNVTLPVNTTVYRVPTNSRKFARLGQSRDVIKKPLTNQNPVYTSEGDTEWLVVNGAPHGVGYVPLGDIYATNDTDAKLDTPLQIEQGGRTELIKTPELLQDYMVGLLMSGGSIDNDRHKSDTVHLHLKGFTFNGLVGERKQDFISQAEHSRELDLSKAVG